MDGERTDLVSGVSRLGWEDGRWVERWTRLVDGAHHVEPPLWNYDEFRFIDVLVPLPGPELYAGCLIVAGVAAAASALRPTRAGIGLAALRSNRRRRRTLLRPQFPL